MSTLSLLLSIAALAGAFVGLINPKFVGLGKWRRFRVFISGIAIFSAFFVLFVATFDITGPEYTHGKSYDDMTVEERVNYEVEKRAKEREARERVAAKAAQPKPAPQPAAVVVNSPWDGSVRQVKDFLRQNLKDPDSFEALSWGKVADIGDGYTVWVKYRANNSFGGKVIEAQWFRLNRNGRIVEVKPFQQ